MNDLPSAQCTVHRARPALSWSFRPNIPCIRKDELLETLGWLRVDLALRPAQEEVWAAVMDQVLDELGEQWGVEI